MRIGLEGTKGDPCRAHCLEDRPARVSVRSRSWRRAVRHRSRSGAPELQLGRSADSGPPGASEARTQMYWQQLEPRAKRADEDSGGYGGPTITLGPSCCQYISARGGAPRARPGGGSRPSRAAGPKLPRARRRDPRQCAECRPSADTRPRSRIRRSRLCPGAPRPPRRAADGSSQSRVEAPNDRECFASPERGRSRRPAVAAPAPIRVLPPSPQRRAISTGRGERAGLRAARAVARGRVASGAPRNRITRRNEASSTSSGNLRRPWQGGRFAPCLA